MGERSPRRLGRRALSRRLRFDQVQIARGDRAKNAVPNRWFAPLLVLAQRAHPVDARARVPIAGAAHEPPLGRRLGRFRHRARRRARRDGLGHRAALGVGAVGRGGCGDAPSLRRVVRQRARERSRRAPRGRASRRPSSRFRSRSSASGSRCHSEQTVDAVLGASGGAAVRPFRRRRMVAPAEPRLRQLPFEPERRDACARQAEAALVHEVARLPAREELRVEPVETLDLEPGVAEGEHAAERALGEAAAARG